MADAADPTAGWVGRAPGGRRQREAWEAQTRRYPGGAARPAAAVVDHYPDVAPGPPPPVPGVDAAPPPPRWAGRVGCRRREARGRSPRARLARREAHDSGRGR